MSKRKRWLLWSAVSSLPQALKVSLDDQLKLGAEHAAKHDGEIVGKLIVPGQSRNIVLFETARKKIKAYDELAGMIERREFDIFAFLDRSRLGRTAALSMTVVALCEEAGILCYELESPPTSLDIDESHDSMLIGAIKSVGAEREVQKIQIRHASGMAGRVSSGKFPTTPPFGYMLDPNTREYRVVINENEAAVIRKIVELYLAGRGDLKIQDELNAIGARSRTNTPVAAMKILRNIDIYAGKLIYNRSSRKRQRIEVQGSHPAIIDQQTYDAVLAEKKSRNGNRKVSSGQCNVLSGVCYCVDCNAKMHLNITEAHGKPYPYICCVVIRRSGQKHRARYETIISELKEFISKFDINSIDLSGIQQTTGTGFIDERRALTHQSIEKLKTSKARATSALVDGLIDADEYKLQRDRLDNEIRKHTEELDLLASEERDIARQAGLKDRIIEFIHAAPAILDGTDVNRINAWLRSSCRIYIKDKHIYHIDII